MSNIIQAPCGLRLDGNNFSVKKNSGGGYLTSNSPFIITLSEQDDGSLLTNIDFEDAKELVKTTPIKFALSVKYTDKNRIINTFEVLPTAYVSENYLTGKIVVPSYCSDPYEFSEEFEPKDIGECFFILSKNHKFTVWTKEGIRYLGRPE